MKERHAGVSRTIAVDVPADGRDELHYGGPGSSQEDQVTIRLAHVKVQQFPVPGV